MKTLELVKLEKETEKAVNVTILYNGEQVTIWLPKSMADVFDTTVEVNEYFWSKKEVEILETLNGKGHIRLFGEIKEYEKSFGIKVTLYEHLSEQEIHRMMFFPKSQVVDVTENSFIVPAWLFNLKEKELKQENAHGTFRASSIDVEIEKEYVKL